MSEVKKARENRWAIMVGGITVDHKSTISLAVKLLENQTMDGNSIEVIEYSAVEELVEALEKYDDAFTSFDPEDKASRLSMRKAVIGARQVLAKFKQKNEGGE